jgi:nicotinate phosphoribosyltransferase
MDTVPLHRASRAFDTVAESVLLTDLYELTMLQAYFAQRMNGTAVFEFFVRKLPRERNFLLAARREQVLDYLHDLAFSAEDLAWLRESGRFTPAFVDSLADLRFTGDVDAMHEGTVFFADEPILRITAPVPPPTATNGFLIHWSLVRRTELNNREIAGPVG